MRLAIPVDHHDTPTMMHDEATIVIRSGNGGDGCVSFRREKYVPEGGPDGGDGGRGGDVVIIARRNLNTLSAFIRRRHWKAPHGEQGGSRNCSGAKGNDLVLEVPCGTLVIDADSQALIADMTSPDQPFVVAAGGIGGKGNTRFKSATNQTPRKATPGQPGTQLSLRLELKLMADVGVIGFPNAGKSTLLSRLSRATPKIGAYPFTTLEPQPGVIERDGRSIVMADIPGLIAGAAEGVGLGHQFLRHVERCRLLLHLVDGSEGESDAMLERIEVLNNELRRFSPLLAGKEQVVVLNKQDVCPELPAIAREISQRLGLPVLTVSGVSGEGLRDLENTLLQRVPESLVEE
ncbi:MAG: GTPase ObgE [Planctomycetota bacterium]|nr:MAG: GTPase ObgE [Planctomycetota bacterium]